MCTPVHTRQSRDGVLIGVTAEVLGVYFYALSKGYTASFHFSDVLVVAPIILLCRFQTVLLVFSLANFDLSTACRLTANLSGILVAQSDFSVRLVGSVLVP